MGNVPENRIFIIAIDDKTLQEYDPMSQWSRDISKQLVEVLNQDETKKPAVITFDIMYLEHTDESVDQAFADACATGLMDSYAPAISHGSQMYGVEIQANITDANNPTQSLLKSDSKYEGNLYVVCDDGTFTKDLTIAESTKNYVFYIKTTSGAITEKVDLGEIIIDKSEPDDSEEPDESEPVPPMEETPIEPEEERIFPTIITTGRIRLNIGTAYEFGKETWRLYGDKTNYVGDKVTTMLKVIHA